tara:strand:+ start:4618 stop:5772 length:1155 start_codon:yes stop_codon:yes gene_type:complete
VANYTTPTIDTYTVKEVLNKVINSGADALKVDIDNVTLTTEGSDIAIDVALDKANDSVLIYGNTNKAGSGTSYVPLVDADGHLQVDTLSSALPTGAATAANQATIIGHVDGIEGLLTTIDADTGAIKTAIELLDNAVDGNYLNVNANIAGTDFVGGAGAVAAGVQRVTLASDDPAVTDLAAMETLLGTIDADTGAIKTAVEILDNAISGTEMQVDVVAALPSGTNTIGKVEVVGDVAENANAAGNPVLVAGRYDSPGNDNSSLRTLGDTDVGALALDPTGAVYVREALGQAGCAFVSGTSAVTAAYGKFVAIQFLEDTVFNSTNGLVATDTGRWADDSAAASDVSSSNTDAVGTQVFPQGMTIFGRWDSFILASGAVIAYVGNV